jgi:hypothetical protein
MMAKRLDRKSPMQIAEDAMPGWKAIEEVEFASVKDATEKMQEMSPDMTGVDLDALRRKFGAPSGARQPTTPESAAGKGETRLVRMRSKDGQDPVGEKIAVVSGDRLVGVQG